MIELAQDENRALQDKKFMRQAIDEARKALVEQEVPIGAVVVCGERVIGRGHNLVETLCDATAHAEMQSITAAATTLGGKYLKGCTIYVTVEPCVMCAGALAWSQIDRVVADCTSSQVPMVPKASLHAEEGKTASRMGAVTAATARWGSRK